MKLLNNGQAALIGFDTQIDAAFFEEHPTVRIIGSATTGVDHIDFKECERRGIKVISLGTVGNRDEETEGFLETVTSTAEFTLHLILSLARRHAPGVKMRGKTLALIGGAGRIGRMVARYGEALGMRVLSHDPVLVGCSTLETLLGQSDFVSVHIPLAGNAGFFTDVMFAQMKPTAYFLNTSRAGIVAEGALYRALENGTIAGAASDFAVDETPHEKLLATDHVAGKTVEDLALTEDFILKKIAEYAVQHQKK